MTAAAVLDRPARSVVVEQGGGSMKRPTATQQLSAEARCRDCTWRLHAPNAQAVAARHTDAHQHQTVVVTSTEIVYGVGGSTPGGSAQTAIAIPGLLS